MRLLTFFAFTFLLELASVGQATSPARARMVDPGAMDTAVDPCADFFTYACGGWIKNNPIPPDQASWSVYSKLQDDNRMILRQILEAAAAPAPQRSANDQKIGDYYGSCIDEQAIQAAGIAPLQQDLKRIDDIKSPADLADFVAYFHPKDLGVYFGQSAMFSLRAEQDAKDSSETIAAVDQGGLGMPDRDYYVKNDARSEQMRKDYAAHAQNMFELLGDNPETAAANAQIVVRIETALAKGSMSRVERRDPNAVYHKMNRAELKALAPSFPWDRYFAALNLQAVESFNVASPDFFKALETQMNAEGIPAWKVYFRWHLLHSQARWLPSSFVDEDFSFYSQKLTGAKQLQPRWKRCVRFTDRALGEALGQAYVDKFFSPEAKQRALKMVESIEAAMEQDLEHLSWMSDETRKQALIKLHAVTNKIGYPDKWRDYTALKIVRGEALANGERANEFEFRRQLNKIGKPLERGEWYLTPPTIDANYDAAMNEINFPAGVLQPPLFDPHADDASNYGQTGATVGHELTHGFDDEGRQYDAHGNLRDWWTPADTTEFEKRTACISGQYSSYVVVDDVKINGKLTLGEDVADLGGLLLAYMAWETTSRGQKLSPIDGFSPVQRFFLAYAQGWCGSQRPEVQRMRATVDPHSPERYRTNGVVSNMPEFQKAFNCKAGAPMVRDPVCRVW